MQSFSKFVTPIPLWIRMRIYVNVINKSETVPQHRQLYTISFSDTLPLTSTRSGTKLSLRLSARLSKYRRSQIVLERYVKLSMLCTFILHLIFFLFLILYPQHTPRLWEEMVVFLSYFLLHLFLFWGGWDFVFSFFTYSTLLACGRCFMLSTIPLHRILCCRRISSLLPCLLVCFRAKGCLMICFLFFRMSNIY